MYISDLNKCEEIIAGDHSILRELLNSNKEDFGFRYSLAHAVVKPKKSTKPHILKVSEVCYILEGNGIMYIGNESRNVYSGCAVYIPPEAKQYIENTGDADLKFLCIADPAWRPEIEEIL